MLSAKIDEQWVCPAPRFVETKNHNLRLEFYFNF